MRLLICAIITVVIAGTARADDWRNYLQVSCAPSIQHFSVKSFGTYVFNAPEPLGGFLALDRGTTQKADGSLDVAPRSDLFARCEVDHWDDAHKFAPYVFEVIRTKSWGRLDCDGCGTWSGQFEVRLNGRVLASGQVGRHNVEEMEDVQFDSNEVLLCRPSRFAYRPASPDGRFTRACRSLAPADLSALMKPR